ncbi:MAG: hypothetical protein D6732_22490 [Methanobacteriota archaeon]|nr:MAG: hypothetical protein D6732_22490 [Euryarchaeota archaeon]
MLIPVVSEQKIHPSIYLRENCTNSECWSCKLWDEVGHLPINHECSFDKRYQDFHEDMIWRHMFFCWIKHDPNPFTGDEWEIVPIYTCKDMNRTFSSSFARTLDGSEKFYTPAIPTFIPLLRDIRILTRHFRISRHANGHENPRSYGYWNRLVLKTILPKKLRGLVHIAHKTDFKKFEKLFYQMGGLGLPFSPKVIYEISISKNFYETNRFKRYLKLSKLQNVFPSLQKEIIPHH